MWWPCWFLWLVTARKSAVVRQLAPELGVHFGVFKPKLLAYCPQVLAGLKVVLRSLLLRAQCTVGWISKTQSLEMFSQPTVISAQTEDESYPLLFSLQADFCFCFRRVLIYRKGCRGGVEGVSLWPLPVCLQFRFRRCQHVLAPIGALPCCWTEHTGCCVVTGWEGQWAHSWATEEQTGSQRAGQYSDGCSLTQSCVL